MKDVVLGLVNMESAVGDVEANLATMERWAKEAAKAGVEILLYPELCVTGYDCSDAGPLFPEAIPPIPSDVTDRLCAMAAEHGMMMLPGLLEREPGGAVIVQACTPACPHDPEPEPGPTTLSRAAASSCRPGGC